MSKKKVENALVAQFGAAQASVMKNRLIGRSYGEVKSGRSRLWLTAPAPIVAFTFSPDEYEGVAADQFAAKDIYVNTYDWVPTDELEQDEAIAIRDKFIEDWEYAIQHVDHGTLLVDKETTLWELFRYAEFGAPNDAPRNYPQLNQRYRKYLNMPKAGICNAGFIQDMKDEWKTVPKKDKNGVIVGEKGSSTGNRVSMGFSELEAIVHMNLFHFRRGGDFYLRPEGIRGPAACDVQGQEYENLSFPEFASLVFPETSPEDWQ